MHASENPATPLVAPARFQNPATGSSQTTEATYEVVPDGTF